MITDQTWREAIEDAFAGVDRALERRREILQAAHDAGLSIRQIADVAPVSFATVHRIIGLTGGQQNNGLLDEPATIKRGET